MKSTGEVMGISDSFGMAFAKSQIAAGNKLPLFGKVFITVKNADKRAIVYIAKRLEDLGFKICATSGTAKALKSGGIDVEKVYKVHEGRPNIVDLIKNGEIQLIINTPSGRISKADEIAIRKAAISYGVPLITTISGAQAVVSGIEELIRRRKITVRSLQEYHAKSYIYANSISSY